MSARAGPLSSSSSALRRSKDSCVSLVVAGASDMLLLYKGEDRPQPVWRHSLGQPATVDQAGDSRLGGAHGLAELPGSAIRRGDRDHLPAHDAEVGIEGLKRARGA